MYGSYRQFINREPFEFFIQSEWEIRKAFHKTEQELQIFLGNLHKLFRLFYGLLPKNSKLRENLDSTKKLFKEDLIKQFSKFIITDGEYSSGLYTNTEGVFLERMYR